MPRPRTTPNRVVPARVNNRTVAEVTFAADGVSIVCVVWSANPGGVSGPDRERAVASLVRANKALDPKEDHDRLYDCLWGSVPRG